MNEIWKAGEGGSPEVPKVLKAGVEPETGLVLEAHRMSHKVPM